MAAALIGAAAALQLALAAAAARRSAASASRRIGISAHQIMAHRGGSAHRWRSRSAAGA